MRIISQSGRTDLNYDKCAIVVEDNYIEARTTSQTYLMAKYSGYGVAEMMATKMLMAYKNNASYFQFPSKMEV